MASNFFSRLLYRKNSRRHSITDKGHFSAPVYYLGKLQTICPVGEAMCGSVAEIYENAQPNLAAGFLPRFTLEVLDEKLLLTSQDEQNGAELFFDFKRIVYCGVDRTKKKIFAFNYHETRGNERWLCRTHAFLCTSRSSAKKLAFAVSGYFESIRYFAVEDTEEDRESTHSLKSSSKARPQSEELSERKEDSSVSATNNGVSKDAEIENILHNEEKPPSLNNGCVRKRYISRNKKEQIREKCANESECTTEAEDEKSSNSSELPTGQESTPLLGHSRPFIEQLTHAGDTKYIQLGQKCFVFESTV